MSLKRNKNIKLVNEINKLVTEYQVNNFMSKLYYAKPDLVYLIRFKYILKYNYHYYYIIVIMIRND